MQSQTDVLIIGGGLAGLTAALHLNKAGLKVVLVEKNEYPNHKVCGEYISNEVLPYLKWLDLEIEQLRPTKINKLEFSTLSGQKINMVLPLGGFGISRYELDHFLYQQLIARGTTVIIDTVNDITITSELSSVSTSANGILKAKQLIGAYGKRSIIDKKLGRDFISEKSPFLGVKAHYKGDFPDDLVGLHHFDGGYCGVSKVENEEINICYLADYRTFKRFKNIASYQKAVLEENQALKQILGGCKMIFEEPLTISQLSFGAKGAVVDHVLMVGDTAGLIHPLCGNGMAMAIHSAKICSELLIKFFEGKIESKQKLESTYTRLWNRQFKSRLRMGSLLSAILSNKKVTNILLSLLVKMPFILKRIVKKTHGKPLIFNA